jgi:hypothetical protein
MLSIMSHYILVFPVWSAFAQISIFLRPHLHQFPLTTPTISPAAIELKIYSVLSGDATTFRCSRRRGQRNVCSGRVNEVVSVMKGSVEVWVNAFRCTLRLSQASGGHGEAGGMNRDVSDECSPC